MDKKLTIKESFNLGKGWNLMIFAILAMLVTNAGVNDGLNIALPEIAKGAGLDYELCLSMGTVLIVGFSLGGSTNMSLSFPASIFGVLDYPKVNGVIFPINYCIGCLNFVVNAVVMKITGSLTGAYVVYLCLFLINIVIVARTEEGKWDKLKHPELMNH